MKPIIGITRCSALDDYVASVEASGGRPRVLDVSESPKQVLAEIHGLLLTGGGDIDPVNTRPWISASTLRGLSLTSRMRGRPPEASTEAT